jgi:hypothetical protein
LSGKILFSSISPDGEENLKEELFACFKYVGIPFKELYHMPVRDRRYFIIKHNEYNEREKNAMEGKNNENQTSMIDGYTDIEQAKIGKEKAI